jgi:acyl-CoA thioester hydrolase
VNATLDAAALTALPIYRARIEPEWMDYNGHLRDAYYGLVLSYAIDDVMDHLGLDATYRERTRCTLYTLELHLRYWHEVKGSDDLQVQTSILDADRKRIHLGCRFACSRLSDAVATAEVMLLHVQQGDRPASAAFPADVERTLDSLKLPAAALAAWGPASRRLELSRTIEPKRR